MQVVLKTRTILYRGRSSIIETNSDLLTLFKNFIGNDNDRVHYGTVVSGDQRIRDNVISMRLRENYKALAVDQEIASFSHVCYLNRRLFLCIKSVSDKANNSTVEDQLLYKLQACDNSCSIVLDFLGYQRS